MWKRAGLAAKPGAVYVKSITTSNFRFKKKDFYHFVPVSLFVIYKISIFVYDASLPGFDETQNGYFIVDSNLFGVKMTSTNSCHKKKQSLLGNLS